MTDDTNPEANDALEARLAEYGRTLQTAAATTRPGTNRAAPTAIVRAVDRDHADLGASAAPTRQARRWRTGVLVAAALALIAGIGVLSLRSNDAGTTLEVAAEPSSIAAPRTDDGLQDGADDGNETSDVGKFDSGEESAGNDRSEQQEFGASDTVEAGDSVEDGAEGEPISSEDVEAPEPELICEVGILRDDVCVVLGDPPVSDPDFCPLSATVFEDDQGCYAVVQSSLDCDGLEVYDENSCLQYVEREPAPLVCPEGYDLRSADQSCTRPTASHTTCAVGILEGSQCVVVGDPPTRPLPHCPVGENIVEHDGTCYQTDEPTCGDLAPAYAPNECRVPGTVVTTTECTSSPDHGMVDGQCATSSPGEEYCEGDAFIEGSDCLRIEEFENVLRCPTPFFDPDTGQELCEFREPTLVNCDQYEPLHPTEPLSDDRQCVHLVGPPILVMTCSETGQVVDAVEDCFTPTPATCAATGCTIEISKIYYPSSCGEGFELQPANEACVQYQSATVGCIEGSLDFDGVNCVAIVETLAEGARCPVSDLVFDDGVSCFRLLPRIGCGVLAEAEGGGCLLPEPLIPGISRCRQEGYELVGEDCVRYAAPTELAG